MSARRKRALLAGGLIVVALLAVYAGLQPHRSVEVESAVRSEEIPSERAPEMKRSAAPTPAPPAIDAGSAFEALRQCAYASRELVATAELSDCSQYEGRAELQGLYAKCLNGWMNVPNRKVAAEAALKNAGCGDTTDIEVRYFNATKQAAAAGDPDAQMCYVESNFDDSLFMAAELEEYGRVAPGYVDAAIRRGDWRIVQFMTKSDFHPEVEPFRQIPGIGSKETIYRMTRLLRLGASGAYARLLDLTLNGMIHPDLVPEAALPAEAVRSGDEWAQQTFNEYFSGVVGLTESPSVCMEPPGKIDRLPGPAFQRERS